MQMGGVEMLAHHVAAFVSVAATLFCGEAHMYTLALLATEWTTPFINFRWLLEKLVCCTPAMLCGEETSADITAAVETQTELAVSGVEDIPFS